MKSQDLGPLYLKKISSPIGNLFLVSNGKKLLELAFDYDWKRFEGLGYIKKKCPVLEETAKQLKEYFAGKRTTFKIPMDPHGTAFQKKAWKALLTIPYGGVISYSEQAQRVSNPKAVRGIGSANGKNPISIIIPCHRVIGKNKTLTGYGGGLDKKKFLLELEGNTIQDYNLI